MNDALNGYKWKCICQELDNYLRTEMKYKNVDTMKVEDVREKLYQLIDEENLLLHE